MAKLVVTNKLLEDVLDEFAERILIVKRLLHMALSLPDLVSTRVLCKTMFDLLSQPLKTEFLAEWLDSEEEEEDE